MARDGTNRGGRRVRAGTKPEPLADRLADGRTDRILATDEMPEPYDFTSTDTPTKAARSSFQSVCWRPMRSRSCGSSNARKPFPISGCWVSTRQRVLRSRPRLWPCRRVFRSRRMCCGTRFSTSSKPTAPRPHPHGNNVEKYQALGSRESPFWALTGVR